MYDLHTHNNGIINLSFICKSVCVSSDLLVNVCDGFSHRLDLDAPKVPAFSANSYNSFVVYSFLAPLHAFPMALTTTNDTTVPHYMDVSWIDTKTLIICIMHV